MTIAELNEHKAKYEDLIKVRRLIGEQGAKLEKTMNEAQRERMRLWGLANKCMDRVLEALEVQV